MTQLEERLRRGMKKYSERVRPDAIRPLREPLRPRRSLAVRWLAPVAAAIAVAGIIAGVSLAGQSAPLPSTPLQTHTPSSARAMRGAPRYYVTVVQAYEGNDGVRTRAVVHDSATGAALASRNVPTPEIQGGYPGFDIASAADDLTSVIYTTGGIEAGSGRVYLLRLSANGRSVTLTRVRLTLPGSLSVDYLALSPTGTRLAMQEQHCSNKGCEYTGIRVVTLATGAVRTWTTTENGAPFNVSWVGSTRVAFLWQVHGPSDYRLLSLTGPGSNLLASKPIASPRAEKSGYVPAALVTANGRTVITSTVSSGTGTVTAKIIELDAQTGKVLRVLSTVTGSASALDEGCNVLSLGPSGVHVLVACPSFGRLDGRVFTLLPGFPSPSSSGVGLQTTGAW
jgi:hypothetical protein